MRKHIVVMIFLVFVLFGCGKKNEETQLPDIQNSQTPNHSDEIGSLNNDTFSISNINEVIIYAKGASQNISLEMFETSNLMAEIQSIFTQNLAVMNLAVIDIEEYKETSSAVELTFAQNENLEVSLLEKKTQLIQGCDAIFVDFDNMLLFFSKNGVYQSGPLGEFQNSEKLMEIVATIQSEMPIKDSSDDCEDEFECRKPVIYLYPECKTEVSVKLDLKGNMTCTYPAYQDGWLVTAFPNGDIINQSDHKRYSYLYWEGITDINYDFSKGFVVKGEDTASFLQETLSKMGLTPNEYNEFIVYWLPFMKNNPYNLISFQEKAYTDSAKLEISPRPDSMLRVFMAYQSLQQPINIEPQDLHAFVRTGFCVVEWGGTETIK